MVSTTAIHKAWRASVVDLICVNRLPRPDVDKAVTVYKQKVKISDNPAE